MHALSHHALFEEALCVVVGKGYRMGADRVTHLAQLTGASWILPTPDSPARLAAEHLFRAAGLPLPTDIVESLSILTNIGLLLRAPYVALMPRTAARQFSDAGLLRILDLPKWARSARLAIRCACIASPAPRAGLSSPACAMPRRMGATRRSRRY